LSAYGVVQPIARQLGTSQLGTLHERVGDTLTLDNAGDAAEGWARSAWGRVIGQQIDNRYQAFADPRTNGRILGMQSGIDLLRASFQPGHRDVGGLYFSYLNGNADVDGLVTNLAANAYVLQHTGTVNLNAYSLGGYWTHYGPGGWYLDAVLQGTRYGGDTTATFSSLGVSVQSNLPTSGSGFVGSLEAGYPIPIPQLGPNFILEPQAQIIWQHTDFDQKNDGFSTVGLGSTSGTTGRLGVRGQWTMLDANGGMWQPYGRFNVWQDWGGSADTLFSGSGFSVPLLDHATRLEFAGGLTYKLEHNLSFYAQAGYECAIAPNHVQRDGVKGDIGLRYTW
jgi:outer membrane autotransporter protein